MGSIMSAIRDDIDEYEELCRKYGEKVQYSAGSADCYGAHATMLKERQREEWRLRVIVSNASMPKQDDAPFTSQ